MIYGEPVIPPGGFYEYLENRIQSQNRRSQCLFQ